MQELITERIFHSTEKIENVVFDESPLHVMSFGMEKNNMVGFVESP